MKIAHINDIKTLRNMLRTLGYKIIVVCGYDNVGKGFLLDSLEKEYPVFHPDYSLICDNVSKDKRWSYFMYFLDIFNSFKEAIKLEKSIIFDRSSLCGSVYNNDPSIAIEYNNRIKDLPIMHILVSCNEYTYNKLLTVRNNETIFTYENYIIHTERYRNYMDLLGIDYIEFENIYDDTLGTFLSKVCGGCSHFKSGICTNPKVLDKSNINYESERCEFSSYKEVQDK